jgi:hypothetical protein
MAHLIKHQYDGRTTISSTPRTSTGPKQNQPICPGGLDNRLFTSSSCSTRVDTPNQYLASVAKLPGNIPVASGAMATVRVSQYCGFPCGLHPQFGSIAAISSAAASATTAGSPQRDDGCARRHRPSAGWRGGASHIAVHRQLCKRRKASRTSSSPVLGSGPPTQERPDPHLHLCQLKSLSALTWSSCSQPPTASNLHPSVVHSPKRYILPPNRFYVQYAPLSRYKHSYIIPGSNYKDTLTLLLASNFNMPLPDASIVLFQILVVEGFR